MYELFYDCIKRDATTAHQLVDDIYSLPITVVEALDRPLMQNAGAFKVAYRISLADSVALGLDIHALGRTTVNENSGLGRRPARATIFKSAQQLNAQLVSSDHHEFDQIEVDEKARFFWIR